MGASHKGETNFYGGSGHLETPWKAPEYLYRLFDLLCSQAIWLKNPKRSGLRINCFEKNPGFLQVCHFNFGNSRQNKASPLDIQQNCVTPLLNFKSKNQARPTESPHDQIAPGNPTSILVDPWDFQILFFQCSWKFHVFNPPVWIFFWNNLMRNENTSSTSLYSTMIS